MEEALRRLNWCWVEWLSALAVGDNRGVEMFGFAKCQIKAVLGDMGYELGLDKEKGYFIKKEGEEI